MPDHQTREPPPASGLRPSHLKNARNDWLAKVQSYLIK